MSSPVSLESFYKYANYEFTTLGNEICRVFSQFSKQESCICYLADKIGEIMGTFKVFQEETRLKLGLLESALIQHQENQMDLDQLKTALLDLDKTRKLQNEVHDKQMKKLTAQLHQADQLKNAFKAYMENVSVTGKKHDQEMAEPVQKERNFGLVVTGLDIQQQNRLGFLNFCRDHLHLTVHPHELKCVSQLKNCELMLVTFTNLSTRQEVYRRRVQLKQTKFYINEYLSRDNEELDYHARQYYKQKLLHKNWTYMGQVFVQVREGQKPLKIISLNNLNIIAGQLI